MAQAKKQGSKSTLCTRGTISYLKEFFNSKLIQQNIILLTVSIRRNQKSRNMINMALALLYLGHDVLILTTDIENNLWQDELSKINIRLINVLVPHSVFGYFTGKFKLLRTIVLSFWATMYSTGKLTIVLNDTCAVSIPILKLFGNFKVIYFQYFYQLENMPSQKYVLSITPTIMQNWAINYADDVVVQNYLSGKIFTRAFGNNIMPKILYPCIDVGAMEREECLSMVNISHEFHTENCLFYLITGSYHPRSNFELAIDAFELLYVNLLRRNYVPLPLLVIAGKFNELDEHQRKYMYKLIDKMNMLNCSSNIVMLKKCSTQTKKTLLTYCLAVLHTTSQELFGNQILEAMYMGRPVITSNDGVAVEYVTKQCGILVKPNVHSFASAMGNLLKNNNLRDLLGIEAKHYFRQHFSFVKYANALNCYVERLSLKHNPPAVEQNIITNNCYRKVVKRNKT